MMLLPDYKLVGAPGKFRNGHGEKAKCFAQKYRLLAEVPRKVRSVSLATTDLTTARRRAVRYVEDRIRKGLLASDPQARTASQGVAKALTEYLANLAATGNTTKQVAMVKMRINRVIKQGKIREFKQVDGVVVTKAIAKLMKKYKFCINTANKYVEAMRAWSRWMKKNDRWPTNALENLGKLKGDTTPTRIRAILSDEEFVTLLQTTKDGPNRRNLSPEKRYWLYLIGSQTGCRARELHSLTPKSFHLDAEPPYVEVHCTISKRRTTDRIVLRRDFAEMMRPWLDEHDPDRRLWGNSASWFNKAATMLRADLEAAGIDHERGDAVIDFHSFRALRVTQAILSGLSSRTVMAAVRLSSEALLSRYTKLSEQQVAAVADAVPLPKLPLKVVG